MDPIMKRRISANVKSKDTEISKLQALNLDDVGMGLGTGGSGGVF